MTDWTIKESDNIMNQPAEAGEVIITIRRRYIEGGDKIVYTVATETEGYEMVFGNHYEHSLPFILKRLGRNIELKRLARYTEK